MSAKIAVISSITWLIGWMRPRRPAAAHRQGDVDRLGREARVERGVASAPPRSAIAAVTRSFRPLISGPCSLRSSGVMAPSVFSSSETEPFLPSAATRRPRARPRRGRPTPPTAGMFREWRNPTCHNRSHVRDGVPERTGGFCHARRGLSSAGMQWRRTCPAAAAAQRQECAKAGTLRDPACQDSPSTNHGLRERAEIPRGRRFAPPGATEVGGIAAISRSCRARPG